MSVTTNEIDEIFGPIRDVYLMHLVNAIREATVASPGSAHEPIVHDPDGSVLKTGALNLPRRQDIMRDGSDGLDAETVGAPRLLDFQPLELTVTTGLTVRIAPCHWNQLWIMVQPFCDSALLMRIRLWYLDWFQARLVRNPKEVCSVIHHLDGPHRYQGAHWFLLDMGSAPVDAISALIRLLAAENIDEVHFGGTPVFAESGD